METKDWIQMAASVVAPFVGAFLAVWVASRERSERIVGFLTWEYDSRVGHTSHLGIQNIGTLPVTVTDIRFVAGRLWWRESVNGLWWTDQDEPGTPLPLVIPPKELAYSQLEPRDAARIASTVTGVRWLIARVLRRHRVAIEIWTARGARVRIPGEMAMKPASRSPWMD